MEMLQPLHGDTVRPLTAVFVLRLNPAVVYQACDRGIEGAWTEFHVCEECDIQLHRIAVFRSIRQARQDEQFGIGRRAGLWFSRHAIQYNISQFVLMQGRDYRRYRRAFYRHWS